MISLSFSFYLLTETRPVETKCRYIDVDLPKANQKKRELYKTLLYDSKKKRKQKEERHVGGVECFNLNERRVNDDHIKLTFQLLRYYFWV